MPRRVLMIDDEDDIREVAALSMEGVAGWHVLVASSAREGLRLALSEHPDAILLDVMMPEIDGPSTFRMLQDCEETRDIPVIFLTAKAQTAEQRALLALGSRGLITKPFDPLTLPAQIESLLGWA
jgi:CheY-like chemotaxis protein